MSLFEFDDYRTYLRHHLKQLPKRGRGELSKIAAHLRTNSTLLSQVLGGNRHFSSEQTYALSQYLGHTDLELEYFSLLVQRERAGTHELKKHLEQRLQHLKGSALQLSKRIAHDHSLTNDERAIFYSSWIYSAVHLFTSTKETGVTLEEVIAYFGLPRTRALEVLRFLQESGLILPEGVNRYKCSVKSTFLEKGSPHLLKHHSNWRMEAIRKSESLRDQELMYTGQFSLSENDFRKLREQMAEFLKTLNNIVYRPEFPGQLTAYTQATA